jgi:hypothetical protein
MTLICERLAMNMTAQLGTDGLTAEQRTETRQHRPDRDVAQHCLLVSAGEPCQRSAG